MTRAQGGPEEDQLEFELELELELELEIAYVYQRCVAPPHEYQRSI